MERTPSPPRRVRTPKAPQYGNDEDPFSPRRSTRVAAKRDIQQDEQQSPRGRRDVTPTASSKRTARISNFTLSPPSSPISSPQLRSPRSTRRAPAEGATIDSDTDHAAPTPARRLFANMAPVSQRPTPGPQGIVNVSKEYSDCAQGMLPTPAKTPRKRALQSESSLSSTARVLFPPRPATIDEVMPTPRKMRKTKNLLTLESFHRDAEDHAEKITIYTDSKERVPEQNDEEDNPFITKKGKGKARATAQKPRKADAQAARMHDAADRDEGMVYLFRGKKIFRKFHNDAPSHDSDVEQDAADLSTRDQVIRRMVGHEAQRPLTRSTVKPRLLFQEEIKQRNLENGIFEDDEEAETEIEAHVATPSRGKGKARIAAIQETTPPPTVRTVKRRKFLP